MNQPPRINAFRPADPEAFKSRCPQFAEYVDWNQGRLWTLINSEHGYRQMASFSLRGQPAVAGINNDLANILADIDSRASTDERAAKVADHARRAVGSMVCEVMEANGFRKTGQRRGVPPEPRRVFVRSEVFELAPPEETSPDEYFDWDEFVAKTSFETVRRLSPELDNRPLPSMYSPDRRWYYVSSLDVDVPTRDEGLLRLALDGVKSRYKSGMEQPRPNHWKLQANTTDVHQLCHLLSKLVSDPAEFEDPDALLQVSE